MTNFVRGYQALIAVSLLLALLEILLNDANRPWWGLLLAALPMALHFTVRLSFKPRPRTRWLMPQQVITLGGLGMTVNPEVVAEPSWLATVLAAALVIALYVYLFKVWKADDDAGSNP
ncbi:hypothetical protein [Saccharospirillum mangrovi]|uniref:hypothetical protein n=1 Tax=Saccharospirillum mangrovi TaxID=2161747 RepID=UPI000D3C8DBE|nr:hypothetical protein [Saccharospirillum mangrovi]